MVPDPDSHEADLLESLQDLCQQIEIGDFKDSLGHSAKMLKAYRDAKRLLEQIEAESTHKNQDVCSYTCTTCGQLSVFPGFSQKMAFTCEHCGKLQTVDEVVQ